jgi:hypothetical protein
MPLKIIFLYDSASDPLQVKGIRVELYDASTATLLDAANSADLNPGPAGQPSREWGVQLNFPIGPNPLDIYITDPLYRYPGNTVRYLNGKVQDRLYIDLLQLPPAAAGQSAAPASSAPEDLADWVEQSDRWSESEKDAVRNLLFNYLSVIVARPERLGTSETFDEMAANWGKALEQLGCPLDLFRRRRSSKRNPPSTPVQWAEEETQRYEEEPRQRYYESY